MNRRTLLKSILVIPFLPKILHGQAEKKKKDNVIGNIWLKEILDRKNRLGESDYKCQTFFCEEHVLLYEGQYVIFAKHESWLECFYYGIRPAKSWKDANESCKDHTFAGVVRERTQCPGFVKIYASKLSLEKQVNENSNTPTLGS